jgi:hypothetical protein
VVRRPSWLDKTLPSTSFLARVGLAGLGGVGVVDWVRRALMRKVSRGRVRSKQHVEMVEADERVVYAEVCDWDDCLLVVS